MSRLLASLILPLSLLAAPLTAQADDDHHHRKHRREFKEEYWDGHCKVERKWKHGEYKEKRKCKDRPVYYAPQPVYHAPPPMVVQRPAIAIQRPEAIVISPQIVIRP
ncbi:MAG: PXPV repeat protein [Comamonas sp.]